MFNTWVSLSLLHTGYKDGHCRHVYPTKMITRHAEWLVMTYTTIPQNSDDEQVVPHTNKFIFIYREYGTSVTVSFNMHNIYASIVFCVGLRCACHGYKVACPFRVLLTAKRCELITGFNINAQSS